MADKKDSILTKEISFRRKPSYPTKQSMNFVRDEVAVSNRRAIAGFIVFLILLGFFVRFGVLLPIQRVNEKQSAYERMQSELDTLKSKNKDYSSVKSQYDEKVGSFLTEDEQGSLNRPEILDMLEQDVMPRVSVQDISISGSQVTVTTDTTTLDTVSLILQTLQSDTRNSYATVTTASASTDDSRLVTAEFVITYGGTPDDTGSSKSSDNSGSGSSDKKSGAADSGNAGSSGSSSQEGGNS